jgi:hypothetical protein
MLDLFKAELRRFRLWALVAFLLHAGLIAFYGRLTDLLQQPPAVVQAVTAVYALIGLLLGLYQMGGYRRPNRWLNLIHRPVDPRRIGLALTGAGLVLLLVAIVLPMLLMLLVQDLLSARVVDLRHWLLPLAALLISLAAYFGGAYAILGTRRYAPLVLILPVMLAFTEAVGLGAIAVQLLVALWLGYLVTTVFKPDLSQIPDRPAALAATAFPVIMAIYLVLLTAGGLAFQLGWIMLGTHPLNSNAPAGGFVQASRAEGADLIAAGLAGRSDPQARLWREQVHISDSFKIQPGFDQLPVRGELTNTVPIEFDDSERGVHWTFSHDSMRFEGRRSLDGGRYESSLGLGESNAPFQRPPVSVGDGTMLDAGSIDQFDPETARIMQRIAVPAGETIAAAPVPVGESLALLTDKALYIYDAQVLTSGDREFPARQRVPLGGQIGNLERIDLIELLDGYLVSETFGRGSPSGESDAWQLLVRLDGSGHVARVARRDLTPDFPTLSRFAGRWLSPLLSEAWGAALSLFGPATPLKAHVPSPVPLMVWVLAAFLSLVAAAGAIWWSARVGLGGLRRLGWIAVSALAGVPALFALMLFHPRRSPPA